MITRVLAILRGSDAGAPRTVDPALDVTAFALADEIDLTMVLKDRGVQLALRGARCRGVTIAGVEVPAPDPAADLAALLASGVRVVVVDEDLARRGISPGDLLADIEVVDEATIARLLLEHDVTLTVLT